MQCNLTNAAEAQIGQCRRANKVVEIQCLLMPTRCDSQAPAPRPLWYVVYIQCSTHGTACTRLLWAAVRASIDLDLSKLSTGSRFLVKNELQQQQQSMPLVFLTVILVRA